MVSSAAGVRCGAISLSFLISTAVAASSGGVARRYWLGLAMPHVFHCQTLDSFDPAANAALICGACASKLKVKRTATEIGVFIALSLLAAIARSCSRKSGREDRQPKRNLRH